MARDGSGRGGPLDRWGELVLYGGAVGAIAAPVKFLVHHVFFWAHLSQPFYSEINAYLIHGHHHVAGAAEWIFGELGDMAIGAIFGILVSFVLRHSRPRYHWWLGIGSGAGIWFATLAFGNLARIIKDKQTDPWSLFAHLVAMIVFGLLIVLGSRIWPAYRERVA